MYGAYKVLTLGREDCLLLALTLALSHVVHLSFRQMP